MNHSHEIIKQMEEKRDLILQEIFKKYPALQIYKINIKDMVMGAIVTGYNLKITLDGIDEKVKGC